MAQTSAEKRKAWNSENYSKVTIDLRKDDKERWKMDASKRGMSFAGLIKAAVEEYLEKN